MRDFIYPVIITVSVITAFTTPYMIKAADPVSNWLQRVLPPHILEKINPPQTSSDGASVAEYNAWGQLMKSYFIRVVLYGVILLAILLAFPRLLNGLADKLVPDMSERLRHVICLVIELIVMTPFLYGLAITNGSISKHASKLLKEKAANRWPILSLLVLRILIAIAFIIAAITSYFQLGAWGVLMVIGAGLVVLLTAKLAFKRFSGLEKRFIENFNEKE